MATNRRVSRVAELIKREVSQMLLNGIRLRRTPEVLFVEDRSIERGTKVLSLLNQLQQQRTLSSIDEVAEEMVE